MPVAAALPAISAGLGIVGSVGSMFHGGQGHVGNTAQGPNDVWPLRQAMMDYLLRGRAGAGSAFGSLMAPGFDSAGNPNSALAGVNNLFQATRDQALAQAKESAGNLTGSGYNNILGSSLASSLAGQQAELGRVGMQGTMGNQQTLMNLFNSFGNQGVGQGQPTYTPGWGSQLAGMGGQLGTIAGMFGGPSGSVRYGGSIDQGTYDAIKRGATPAQGQP